MAHARQAGDAPAPEGYCAAEKSYICIGNNQASRACGRGPCAAGQTTLLALLTEQASRAGGHGARAAGGRRAGAGRLLRGGQIQSSARVTTRRPAQVAVAHARQAKRPYWHC